MLTTADIMPIASLVLLEGLLSADNALVLAVMVRHLPDGQREKALRYGIIGAFGFRLIAVLLASFLMKAWYCKAIGAVYLLYLAGKNLLAKKDDTGKVVISAPSFWKTVVLVELTDIVFSIDSILAAVALSSKKTVVYIGGVLGILAMRFVAGVFLKVLDRFPGLEKGAYVLVAWIGVKLGLHVLQEQVQGFPHLLSETTFWAGMGMIVLLSVWKGKKRECL